MSDEFKALADHTRRRALQLLKQGPRGAGEFADLIRAFGLQIADSQNAITVAKVKTETH